MSGILSVVAAGLFIRFDRTGVGPNVARTNIVSTSVWGVLSFSLNGAVFAGMPLASLVLLGAALGALVSPWFYLLSAFVGAGLVFAGLTGFCGMARLLACMPWNRL